MIISDELFQVLVDFPNTELLIVGPLNIDDKFLSLGNRVIIKEFMAYKEFQNIFNSIDINLIPLEIEEPFCQCKSELKFIEAGAYSVPSIATPTRPHCEVITHERNGLLAEEGEWYENIKKMLDTETRTEIGENAMKTVSKNYSPKIREKDWLSTLTKISNIETRKKSKHLIVIKLQFFLYKTIASIYEKQKSGERFLRVRFLKKVEF